jgi:hypothetical protein
VDAHPFSQQAQEIQTNAIEQKNVGDSILGILLTEFMAPGTTITSEVYYDTLSNLRRSVQNKRRGMLPKGVVLLHDDARPHITARKTALIKSFKWQIFDLPPYSPDLAPSDYHLFSIFVKERVMPGRGTPQ